LNYTRIISRGAAIVILAQAISVVHSFMGYISFHFQPL